MPSPFPGIDPYLENPELWSAVHSRLIVAIADELVDHLSEKYRVEVEKRFYCSSDDESLLVGIPDVAVATGRPTVSRTGNTTFSLPVQPQRVTVPLAEEVTERYLEIREVATGMAFPVPLLPGEEEPILQLQPLLNRVYEKGRYHLAIDYGLSAVPPLSESDHRWLAELLASS